MPVNKDRANKLYDALTARGLNIGTREEYLTAMEDPTRRKRFHQAISQRGFDIGSLGEFENNVWVKPKEPSTPQGQQTAATTKPATGNVGDQTRSANAVNVNAGHVVEDVDAFKAYLANTTSNENARAAMANAKPAQTDTVRPSVARLMDGDTISTPARPIAGVDSVRQTLMASGKDTIETEQQAQANMMALQGATEADSGNATNGELYDPIAAHREQMAKNGYDPNMGDYLRDRYRANGVQGYHYQGEISNPNTLSAEEQAKGADIIAMLDQYNGVKKGDAVDSKRDPMIEAALGRVENRLGEIARGGSDMAKEIAEGDETNLDDYLASSARDVYMLNRLQFQKENEKRIEENIRGGMDADVAMFDSKIKKARQLDSKTMVEQIYESIPQDAIDAAVMSELKKTLEGGQALDKDGVKEVGDFVNNKIANKIAQTIWDTATAEERKQWDSLPALAKVLLEVTDFGIGDMVANLYYGDGAQGEQTARAQWDAEHPVLHGIAVAGNMAIDPVTYLGMGVAGKATEMAAKGAYRGLSTDIAKRAMASTLSGRMAMRGIGGGVNFGVYQGVHSMQDQLTNNGDISLSATLSAVGEGVALGATMGGAGGFIGNVGDRVVRGLEGTASKLTARGVQHGVGLATEATIFAMPEVMQGADFVDAWEDAMAMVLGFKIAGAAKGSLSVGEYLRQPQGRTEGRRQRNVLQNIADRLTAVKDDYLTAEEKEELKKYGYGDIVDMTHTADLERVIDDLDNANSGMVGGKGYLIGDEGEHPQMGREGVYRQTIAKVDGLNEYYDKLEQMLNDNRLSETARNKMLWVITGKQMRLSTITAPSEVIDNGDGTYTVEAYAQDGNAVVSSRRYASRKAAEVAQRDIAHQAELNTIDIGEKYNDGKVDDRMAAYAIGRVSAKYGVKGGNDGTANAIYDIYRRAKAGEEVSEAERRIADEVTAVLEELKPYFADGRSEAIRNRIQNDIKNQTGEDVDIDKALDKRNNKRSAAEQKAIKAYADALFPESARRAEGETASKDTATNGTTGAKSKAEGNTPEQEQGLLEGDGRKTELGHDVGAIDAEKEQMDAEWQSRMAGVSDEAYTQDYEQRLWLMRRNDEVQYAFEKRFGMTLQDFLGEEQPLRKMAKMRAEGASEEDVKLVYEACEAQAADQGAWQRIDDDMNIVANQTALQWQGCVHKDGKTIRPVTLENGDAAYVLSGEVHLREDGSIDTNASDATIVVSNSNTGEKEMVSPGKIASLDGEFDAEDFINNRVQEAKQQFRDKVRQDLESLDNADTETEQGDAQAEQGATPAAEVQNAEGGANAPQMEYGPGMITLKDGRRGFIMDYDPETGEYEYYLEGDLAEYRARGNGGNMTTHKATKEQLDAIVEGFTPDKIDNQVTTGETGNAEDISKTSMPQDKQEEPADESTGTITDRGEKGHDVESVAPTPVEAPQVNMAEDQASEAAQNPTIVGNTANGNAVDNVTNSGDAANVAPVPAAEVNAEGGATETPAAEGASAEAVEQVQSALSRVPKDEKGKPQYHKAETAEIGWDALVESKAKDGRSLEKQEAMADEHLQHMIDDAKKELKRLQDGKEKQRKGEDYGDYQERIESAKEDLEDYIAKMEAMQRVSSERKAAALAQRLAADKAKSQEAKVESEAMSEHDRKWANRKKVVGRSTTRKIEDGTRVRGHWELVEAGTVLASHNPEQGYTKSEGYPVDANGNTVNDRDYERDKSAQQITQQMADQFDEAAIEKPVIVSNRGKVLSGNGRTMAGDMAARRGTDKDYVDYLRREAVVYGIRPEDVDAYEHPRLVFVLDEDIEHNAKNMARFNKSDMKSQSPEALAVKMGKTVSDQSYARILETASRYDSMDQMYADRDAAIEVMKALQNDGVIEVVDREKYINSEGALTEAGKEMLEQVIVGKAFESNPDAVLAINDIKSMRRNVVTALAEINRNKMLGKEWGLEDAFTQAIELVREARLSRKVGEGDKASGFAAVNSMDPEAQKRIEGWRKPLVMLLADILNDKRSTLLKKVLSLYNQRVKDVAAGQSSMFGDDPQSREEAIYETLKTLGYDYEPTVRLAESQQRASQQAAEQPAEPTEPASTNGNGQDGASGRVSKESTGGGGVVEGNPGDESLGTITGSGEKAEGNTLGGDAVGNPRDGQEGKEKKAEKKHVAKYEAEMNSIIAETEDAMAENDRYISEANKGVRGVKKKMAELAKLMGVDQEMLEKYFTNQLGKEEAEAMRKVTAGIPEGESRDRAIKLNNQISDALWKSKVAQEGKDRKYYTDYIAEMQKAIEDYRRNADEVAKMGDKELADYVLANAEAYNEAQMDDAGHGNSMVEVAVEELNERSPKAGKLAYDYLDHGEDEAKARKAIEDAIVQKREEERRNAERIAAAEKRYREAEAKEKQKAKERDELSKKAEEDFLAWAKANNVPTKIEDYPSKEDALKKLDEWKQQSDAYKEYKKARQEWGEALDEWAVTLTSWGTGESMEEAKRRLYQDDKDAGLGKSPLEIAREIAEEEDGKNVAKEPGAQYGGNSGYVGYSMSKRAAQAREEGRYPKTDFKKEYGVSDNALRMLTSLGVIDNSEWHHTSKYGNRTPFYGWAEERYADAYAANKRAIDALARDYGKRMVEAEDSQKRRDEAANAVIEYLRENYDNWMGRTDEIAQTDARYAELRAAEEAAAQAKLPWEVEAELRDEYADKVAELLGENDQVGEKKVRYKGENLFTSAMPSLFDETEGTSRRPVSADNGTRNGGERNANAETETDNRRNAQKRAEAEKAVANAEKEPAKAAKAVGEMVEADSKVPGAEQGEEIVEQREALPAESGKEMTAEEKAAESENISQWHQQSLMDLEENGWDEQSCGRAVVDMGDQWERMARMWGEEPEDPAMAELMDAIAGDLMRARAELYKDIVAGQKIDTKAFALTNKGEVVEYESMATNGKESTEAETDPLLANYRPVDKAKGEWAFVERKFQATGRYDFTGVDKIESPDDVAVMFRWMESAPIERAFAVLVKDGKPTVLLLGVGGTNSTTVDFSAAAAAIERIKPETMYFVHNHPSGNLKQSYEDTKVLEKMRGMVGDCKVEGIIIDTYNNQYSIYGAEADAKKGHTDGRYDRPERQGDANVRVYSFDESAYHMENKPDDEAITHPGAAARIIVGRTLGNGSKVSALILDRPGKAVANVVLEESDINGDTMERIAKKMATDAINFGGSSIIFYGDFPSGMDQDMLSRMDTLTRTYGDVRTLDIMRVKGRNSEYKSLKDGGRLEAIKGKDEAREDGMLFRTSEELDAAKTDERKQKREAAEKIAAEINPDTKIADNGEGVKESAAWKRCQSVIDDANASEADKAKARELQKKLEREPGFYDTETGEVWINIEANKDAEDVVATMLHENAAHKGMREMVGEDRYDDFCVEIFNHMEDELKRKVMDKGYDIPKGVDELLGEMAEKPFEEFDAAERNLWQKVKDIVLKFIERFMGGVNIPKWVKLGDNELRYMLWRSHERMKAKAKEGKRSDGAEAGEGLLDIARDVAKKNELGVDIRFRDPGGETADIFKGGGLSMREKIANAALRLSNSNRADAKLRVDAHQAVGESLKSLVHDMRNRVGTTSRFASADSKVDTQVGKMEKAQARYDRSTVKRMTDLANVLIRNHYLDNATSTEIGKVLSAIADAVGKEDIDAQVSKVMDVLIDNHLRRGEDVLDKLMHVRGSKVNASGVSVAGELDANGAEVMKYAKDGMRMDVAGLDEAILNATDDLGSEDNTKSEAAARKLEGYAIAKDYHDMIKASEAEEIGLREELKDAARDLREGRLSKDAYQQLISTIEDAIRNNKLDRADYYQDIAGKVSGVQMGSVEAKKTWLQAQTERAREVMHDANSDLEGMPVDIHHKETTGDAILNFANTTLLAPLATFEQMMRLFGSKSVNGEGYMWNRHVRGWLRARNKEITGVRDKFGQLDAKVSDVTGGEIKSWGDAKAKLSSKKAPATVSFMDGGEMKEHELTQGNLMYIYMVDKMDDGRMKLRKMGIDEDAVDVITDMLDPRLRELADWMQDEFLVNTRNEYNETHKRVYGASMASIENYFPLKIHKGARKINENVDEPDGVDGGAGTTVTGAIKNRVKNTVALDITGSDAMDVILDHIAEMEHWNAYAEWGRDINTLLSYGKFRNRVTNMHSAMLGTGEQAWDNVRNLCRIAAGTYHQKSSKLDRGALAIARGVTAAKVAFRVNTALKQLLSAPAYLGEVSAKGIYDCLVHPENPWNWCVENLPTFRERWESRISGDPRLKKTDGGWLDWRSNITQKATRLGMTPNAFVDALTVSIGAYAMYKTRLNRYLREGYSNDAAEKRAKEDAAILYNQSQQSSESIFLSQIQANKDWLSTMLTVFRNSPMSYTRQVYASGRNLAKQTPKQREEMVRFMAKQMVREGLDETKAEDNARRRVNRAILKDTVNLATFGFLLPVLWGIGGKWLYYLLGNDEKEKDAMMDDVKARIATAPIEGLTGGDVISNIVAATINNDWSENTLTKEMPITGDVNSIVRKFVGGKNAEGINEVINLMVQAGVGVNPQSLEDAVVGVINACGNDIELAHEASICIANVMNNPQSQIKKLYIDEIGLTGEEASKLTPAQLAERYAQAQVMRGRPLMPWTWDDEEALSREQAVAKKQIKERLNHRMSDEDAADYERYEDIYKTVNNRVSEVTKASKSGYVEIAQQIAEGLKDDATSVAIWNIYKQAHPVLMRITRKYMESGSVQESQYWLRELDNARGQMLDAMRQAEEAKDKAQE